MSTYKRKDSYIRRLAKTVEVSKDDLATRRRVDDLAKKYSFFHWELEMMDAFTDERRGFDLVVGNPPWEKPKPSKDEFFTPYDPTFRTMTTNVAKNNRVNKILQNPEMAKLYKEYRQSFKDKSAFYRTFELQGSGDRDLWQLILERMLELVTVGGTVSVVVPSQILGSVGSSKLRRHLFEMDIVQAYVFENRQKIFPIDTRYRFLLLTVRNRQGMSDEFPAAFYLHHLSTLRGGSGEHKKFTTCSKHKIKIISANDLAIPEVSAKGVAILETLSKYKTLGEQSDDGWHMGLSTGFHTGKDTDLFKSHRKGWPILKGKNMHQFNYSFLVPVFTADSLDGLERLESKNVYAGHCKDFHETYMIVFRNISAPTNMRSMITCIIPPHTFHADSLNSIILLKNNNVYFNDNYNQKIAWISAILNSMTIDFIVRAKAQMNIAPIIRSLPVPPSSQFDEEIGSTAARLVCGGTGTKKELAAFAMSFNIEIKNMSPTERIDATARLDALVAHAYNLSKDEYRMILDSFKFSEDPLLLRAESADWSDNKVLRRFYGEVRKAAMPHFEAIAKERGGA